MSLMTVHTSGETNHELSREQTSQSPLPRRSRRRLFLIIGIGVAAIALGNVEERWTYYFSPDSLEIRIDKEWDLWGFDLWSGSDGPTIADPVRRLIEDGYWTPNDAESPRWRVFAVEPKGRGESRIGEPIGAFIIGRQSKQMSRPLTEEASNWKPDVAAKSWPLLLELERRYIGEYGEKYARQSLIILMANGATDIEDFRDRLTKYNSEIGSGDPKLSQIIEREVAAWRIDEAAVQ